MEEIVTDTGKAPPIWRLLILISLIVIGLWGVYLIVIWFLFPDLGERGQFGDMFGAANALFGGLAFAGVILAIILQKDELGLQRRELELQREELARTREEIRGQRMQLQAQDQTLKRQNFEDSFFQLLRFHVDIVGSLKIGSLTGRDCFAHLVADLRNLYNNAESNKGISHLWRKLAETYLRSADHYFYHLYNTVKFVDQHPFLQNFKEKKHYTDLIRSQLSSDELGLVFYNCLSDRGAKFKSLVETYSLFEVMNLNVLLDETHRNLYDKKAFDTHGLA